MTSGAFRYQSVSIIQGIAPKLSLPSGAPTGVETSWEMDLRLLSPRDITREGFNLRKRVADLVSNDGWKWHQAWLNKTPDLNIVPAPNLSVNCRGTMYWRASNGTFSVFSVKLAWEALRLRGNDVSWWRIVWFPHCIPRHAFHLWLVMRNSLKTQDMLKQWDVGVNTDLNLLQCVFCDSQQESHDHLFFECSYASKVWLNVRQFAEMEAIPPVLSDIIAHLQPMAKKKSTASIIGRLLLVATSYFLWIERNNRLFKNSRRSSEELRDIIMVTICLKLLSFKFKNHDNVTRLLARWKMPNNFRLYGT
ncbi:reverse transcriptase domain, reverse transcriptase zinc-binding domain protein [Tanacetum coccineum]